MFPLQQIQQTTAPVQNSFWAGFHDGVPIGLGYLSVSVTFGMMAVTGGLPVWAAVAISMTNVTSAGQFAGLSLIFGGGTLFETALTQFVINLRYALMSLSLSQKLERRVGLIDRMLFSFMMTDEVFAVASGQKGEVGKRYLFGVMIAPYCGWALGTLCGAVASGFCRRRCAARCPSPFTACSSPSWCPLQSRAAPCWAWWLWLSRSVAPCTGCLC